MTFKIATWNVNSIKIRLNHLIEFIDTYDPDVICLQELKCETTSFPYEEFSTLPYNLYIHGQKKHNGVAILSKVRADNIITEFPANPVPAQARFIEISLNTPIGYARIISLYVPNGGVVGSDSFEMKLEFYDAFTKYIQDIKSFDEKLFICSDFNIAPFDIDVYSPRHLHATTCFTLEEKKKLRTILNCGFVDNYRIKHPNEKEFSWWDYRAGGFAHNRGMRIDSIISNSGAVEYLSDCIIDYATREKTKPSDHAPVIAIYEPKNNISRK